MKVTSHGNLLDAKMAAIGSNNAGDAGLHPNSIVGDIHTHTSSSYVQLSVNSPVLIDLKITALPWLKLAKNGQKVARIS